MEKEISRSLFWCIAPLLLLCGIGMPFIVTDGSPLKIMFCVGWSSSCVFIVLGLYDARRFWWATRSMVAILLLLYFSVLIYTLFFRNEPLIPTSRRGLSPERALQSIIFFVPSLLRMLFAKRPTKNEKKN